MEHKPGMDGLIKNIVLEEGLEAPSYDFTDKVMSTVMETNSKVIVYKPLIPKYVLAGIASLLFLFLLFPFLSGYQLQAAKIPWLDKIANGFKMFHFSLSIPAEISYILASALVMVLIQVFVIGALYKRMYR
jgi:hypothetical protein